LIIPAVWLARRHNMGEAKRDMSRPPVWRSLREAIWGLSAPGIILGGMRMGYFTTTEAAGVTVFYGLLVAQVLAWSLPVRGLFILLREGAELSAVIMLVVSLAGIFAWALSTLSIIDPIARAIVESGIGEYGVMALIIVLLTIVGMFLD